MLSGFCTARLSNLTGIGPAPLNGVSEALLKLASTIVFQQWKAAACCITSGYPQNGFAAVVVVRLIRPDVSFLQKSRDFRNQERSLLVITGRSGIRLARYFMHYSVFEAISSIGAELCGIDGRNNVEPLAGLARWAEKVSKLRGPVGKRRQV